jgi:sugar lactone lactonase YvrE
LTNVHFPDQSGRRRIIRRLARIRTEKIRGEEKMFEPVASGVYLEGLCADGETIWVADPIKGGVRRFRGEELIGAWLPDKKWIGSLLRGPGETVLISGEGGIVRLDAATGAQVTLLDSVDGEALPGVNEMVADRDGAIYFGGNDIAAIMEARQTAPVSIYRREPDGRVTEQVSGLRFSNGIGLSPDGKRLYHNETFVGTSAYDILPDGSLGASERLLDKPDCDGLAVDAEGTLWITGFLTKAIVRLRPDGTMLEPFDIPGGGATNVRFGGPDLRDLYITTVAEGAAMKLAAGLWPEEEDSILYRGRSAAPGLEVPRAAV